MAGKVYELAMKLTAQVSSAFGSTFSSAQKSLSETQKKIAELNSVQSNIAAYQKQQSAIEATNDKLEKYREQLAAVQQKISESGEYNETLANKELALREKIQDTESALKTKEQALGETSEKLQQAGVDTSNLSEENQKLTEQMNALGEEQAAASKGAEEFGSTGSNAFAMIGEAAVAAGLNAFLEEVAQKMREASEEAAEYADQIGTLSAQYGIAEEDLQAYTYAAELVDVSVETITGSMAKNTKAMYAAMDGTGAQAEAYEKLGVAVTDANGELRDSETVYWEVIDALGEMTNESERDGIAMTVLGRSAMQLNPLIQAGSSTMKAYAAEAQSVGYTLSGQTLKSLQKLDDQEQRLKNTQTALKNAIGAQLAPAMTKWKELWTNILSSVVQFVQKHPNVVKGIATAVTVLLTLVKAYLAYKAIKVALIAYEKLHNALKTQEIANESTDIALKEGETVATGSATVAQWALNTAMYACPALAIAGAIGALVGMFSTFTSTVDSSTDSLGEFNSAYDFSSRLEVAKQSLPTMTEEEETVTGAQGAVDKLIELSNTEEQAAQNAGQIKTIVEALNEQFEGLGLTFDATTGKFNKSAKEIKIATTALGTTKTDSQILQQYYENVSRVAVLRQQMLDLEDHYNSHGAWTTKEDIAELVALEQEYKAAYDEYNQLTAEIEKAEQEGSDVQRANVVVRVESIINSIEALKAAYDEAYQSAYDSFSGQYKLWDEADIVAATSVTDANNAIQTQIAYWSDYQQDIDLLTSKTGQIEGLSEMISTFADGSTDSVNMIAGLANSTDEEIAEMVKNWQTLKSQQEETAKSLAELETDYETELDKYTKMLEDTVDDMNFETEAQAAAESTVDAYIDALKNKLPEIEEMAELIKTTIGSGFDVTFDRTTDSSREPNSDQILAYENFQGNGGGAAFEAEYQAEQEAAKQGTVWDNIFDVLTFGAFAEHANGTVNAASGYALLGEEGPELVRMAGGEQVYTAAETKDILSGGGQKIITIAPSFAISGNVDETQMQEYADMIVGMVKDALEEDGINERRGVYA